jgi:formate dehydrogenase subunit delta
MANTEIAHLVSMANDIAINLSFHEDAAERTADHIIRFWAPRMRVLLLDYFTTGGEGLSDNLRSALEKLQD